MTYRASYHIIVLTVLALLIGAAPLSAADKAKTIRLFYSTNRNLLVGDGDKVRYGTELSALSFGRATVSLPATHRCGSLERPNLLQWEFAEDPNHHIMLRTVSQMASERFIAGLCKSVKESDSSDVLVYVHGHSTRFSESIRQAAQLACDMQFEGTVVVFAWPTQGTVSAKCYRSDELNLSASVTELRRLLRMLRLAVPESRIHGLAHSLGCRLTT